MLACNMAMDEPHLRVLPSQITQQFLQGLMLGVVHQVLLIHPLVAQCQGLVGGLNIGDDPASGSFADIP